MNLCSACRTEKLGVVELVCLGCGDVKYVYRSCKHRFCGICGVEATYQWARKSLSRLMEMKHHHVTMTLPKALRELSKMNGNKLHDILFQSSSAVMQSWFMNRHGIRPGIVSVLHTAGSDLKYHPHVHMIVSGGGQDLATGKYIEFKGGYLCKQQFFGRKLQDHFMMEVRKAYGKGELTMHSRIKDEKDLNKWLMGIKEKHWILSVQEALDDVEKIIKYVGRYTKRACLSEYRIESIENDQIVYRFKDYKNSKRGEQPKESIKRQNSVSFLDDLLQHVPDKGYRMVRYYGQYSSSYLKGIPEDQRMKEVETDAKEIEMEDGFEWGEFEEYRKAQLRLGKKDPLYCESCNRYYEVHRIIYTNHRIIKIKDLKLINDSG